MKRRRGSAAFTLIEAIVAVGILGAGLAVIVAMFSPLARVAEADAETVAAAEAAVAVNARLRELDFTAASQAAGQAFLVDRHTSIVGLATDPVWAGRADQQFFSVVPLLNARLAGPGDQADLPWLAFNLRVRWPVTAGAIFVRRELIVPGSIHR